MIRRKANKRMFVCVENNKHTGFGYSHGPHHCAVNCVRTMELGWCAPAERSSAVSLVKAAASGPLGLTPMELSPMAETDPLSFTERRICVYETGSGNWSL
jgi:hypothetical protein